MFNNKYTKIIFIILLLIRLVLTKVLILLIDYIL